MTPVEPSPALWAGLLACRVFAALGLADHDPVLYQPLAEGGAIYRCRRCGTGAATAGELLGLDDADYVPLERIQYRRDRAQTPCKFDGRPREEPEGRRDVWTKSLS